MNHSRCAHDCGGCALLQTGQPTAVAPLFSSNQLDKARMLGCEKMTASGGRTPKSFSICSSIRVAPSESPPDAKKPVSASMTSLLNSTLHIWARRSSVALLRPVRLRIRDGLRHKFRECAAVDLSVGRDGELR